MSIQEAMRLIHDQVARGAAISVSEHPPARCAGYSFPTTWTANLGPVWVGGTTAHPSCTAYSQERAIIGIGELLAHWASA